MYPTRSSGGSGRSGSRPPGFNGEPRFSNGSDDTMTGIYEDDGYAKVDAPYFDRVGGAPNSHERRPTLPMRSSSRRKPVIGSVRVKVHAHEDTRYMMFGSVIDYGDFEGKIREKFRIKSKLKIRMQDEGDMITMGDQDDLDMLLSVAKETARRECSEMAKMEVRFCPLSHKPTKLTNVYRCGYKNSDPPKNLPFLLSRTSICATNFAQSNWTSI